ncbi:hypothetical protein [Polyangium spumosum]|uniref:Uncharacterized protein n=1 Tax=Polyangium spumosum TaxID=889282 RepID=A0A6N7Q154_9BACT|nr:hypothetical protein [Polyangium spumosum]MRG98212.1 hypothetical protein [Polyangium spumosum]
MKTLKVKTVGAILVPDFGAFEQGVLRYVGRRHDPKAGPNGGWVPTEQTVEVPYRLEYLQELRAGSLEAADEETAKHAGISFKAS